MKSDDLQDIISNILNCRRFAVAGASRDTSKYGYLVYKTLKAAGYEVYPVNPNTDYVDGDRVYPELADCPERPEVVVTVVQPEITLEIVRNAGHLHIPYVWMQPGSESAKAVEEMDALGIQGVHSGPCIMVAVHTHPQRQRGIS